MDVQENRAPTDLSRVVQPGRVPSCLDKIPVQEKSLYSDTQV